jgi:aryl-alcohol dehydrogenase-like predicted oxidoreductase
MVKYGEGIWHCLHPDFLDDQLALSLDRLGLQTLDVLLLHNVEYFLSDAKHRGQTDLPRLREEFYRRLQAAFAYLETQVVAGRLQYYGVSSNTCTAEPGDPEATSLSHMIEAARHAAAGGAHHFRVLQLPMNLFESGALLTPNTGKDHGQTVVELAQREQIAILVNRPLNAMPGKGNAMIRLADLQLEPKEADFDPQRDAIATLEEEYRTTFVPHIQPSGQGLPPEDYFRWAAELTRIRPLIQNLEHWEQIEYQMIAPHINQVLRALTQHFNGDLAEKWQGWRDRYLPELLRLLRELRREATLKSREKTSAITRVVDPLLPESRRHHSLSRKALWVLTNTPGVTCVLNGMRTPAYVDDSLEVLGWPPVSNIPAIYKTVKDLRY